MNKTVLITGTSTGIGRASALLLARSGFEVFATVRKQEDAEMLGAEASESLRTLLLDVTDPATLEAAVGEVSAAVGEAGLDGLVNNAGVAVPGPLEFLPLDDFRRQMEVNVTGQLAVTQALLPLLRKAKGRIVNVGSIGGRSTMPFAGAYCASKHALEALSDALRMELDPWGVAVVLIEPGSIATPIWGKGLGATVPAEAHRLYGKTLESVRRLIAGRVAGAAAPERVAEIIHEALIADEPKTRYLVGRDAYLRLVMQRFLPDRLRDRLILNRLAQDT